jgi:hypothetical protein
MEMARPLKPEKQRRSTLFTMKLTQSEWADLKASAENLQMAVAELLREGAALYIQTRGKDGSRK